MSDDARHVVAIIGGAAAGAEMAGTLADRGVEAVVFEQNPRPYGKIEDGLPRWHVALRRKEYRLIDQKLDRPGVHFVPRTRIGRDIPFETLARDWAFTGVVLANGAWRDRPMPVPEAERFVGRGLVYQNPFIYWFNHSNEKGYDGPVYETSDDAIVVGGGLASIDVVKALMIETTRTALRARGIDVDLVEMETAGIPETLAKHDLRWEDLGLRGCTLFYRRRVDDMPLVEAPPGADEARMARIALGRRKILDKAMRKYLFHFSPTMAPKELIVEGDRLAGILFQRTRIEGGKVIDIPGETVAARGSVVISSIGSIPEPIEGVPMKGELLRFTDWNLGRLESFPNVFGAGNVVTGKGNIVASRKHSREVAAWVIERFLGLDGTHEGEEALLDAAHARAREAAAEVADQIMPRPKLPPESVERILARVRERQAAVGYREDYAAWIKQVTPADMV